LRILFLWNFKVSLNVSAMITYVL